MTIHFGETSTHRLPKQTHVSRYTTETQAPMDADVAQQVAAKYQELAAKDDVFVITQSPDAVKDAGVPDEAIIPAPLVDRSGPPYNAFTTNTVRFLTGDDARECKPYISSFRDYDAESGLPSVAKYLGLALLVNHNQDQIQDL